MKLNFWKQFLPGVVLTFAIGGIANADIVIDLTTSETRYARQPLTADLLDVNNNAGEFPLPFDVVEDPAGVFTVDD